MKKSVFVVALLTALSGQAFAQATAAAPAQATAPAKAKSAAATSSDSVVQYRTEVRAIKKDFAAKRVPLKAERSKKMADLVATNLKSDAYKGVDPLIAKRDAQAKARQATKADFDTKMKALNGEEKAALEALRAKYKGPLAAAKAPIK